MPPTSKPYRDYADLLSELFPWKMQKLSVNAGFTCPNRDGSIGTGGCTYCNNASFSPSYCDPSDPVTTQLEKGKAFFGKKYADMRYLAYFQTYTNTLAGNERLLQLYTEALSVDSVEGIVIGTRPDCIPPKLIEALSLLSNGQRGRVMIELGAESSHQRTLTRINRCHTWADTVQAVHAVHTAGIPVGVHLIMGLPGETRDDMLATIDAVNTLPIDMVKIHQLQILRGTRMAREYACHDTDIRLFDVDSYLDLCCDIVCRLRRDIAIDRFISQSPADMLIAPRWGLKNYQFVHLLHRRLTQTATLTSGNDRQCRPMRRDVADGVARF